MNDKSLVPQTPNSSALKIVQAPEEVTVLYDYLLEVKKKIATLFGKYEPGRRALIETYDEGSYYTTPYSLSHAYCTVIHLLHDIIHGKHLIKPNALKRGVKRPLINHLEMLFIFYGIGADLGFTDFAPSSVDALPEVQPAKLVLERFEETLARWSEEDWNTLRALASVYVREQLVIAAFGGNYSASIHSYLGIKDKQVDYETIRILERWHFHIAEFYPSAFPFFEGKNIDYEALAHQTEQVVRAQEERLRTFMHVLHATLGYLASLALWETGISSRGTHAIVPFVEQEYSELFTEQKPSEEQAKTEAVHVFESQPFNEASETDESEFEVGVEETDYEEETTEPVPEKETTEPKPTIKPTHTYLGKCILGNGVEPGKFIEVNDVDRQAGVYVVGVQRMGKSSLLLNMIYQDLIKGYAVIVLDPHGDLINSVIATMPGERVNNTYLLDVTDIDYPFGINLFYCKNPSDRRERARTVGRVVSVFRKIFPEIQGQQYAPHLLEAIAETFIDNPGYTLGDIPQLLTDSEFRKGLVQRVTSRGVRTYWENFNRSSKARKETVSNPLLNKLHEFLLRDFTTNIVEQQVTTIDFREAIMGKVDKDGKMQRSVLLIHLPVENDTYGLSAELIGTMLLSEIYSTTFGFGDLPPDKRPGFSLYADEFQNFATSDFAKLFAQGGKFGIRQTVAHQWRNQLTVEENKQATMSATTRIAFRVNDHDSNELARGFSDLPIYKRPSHIPANIFKELHTYKRSEYVQLFADGYIARMQKYAKDEEMMSLHDYKNCTRPKGDFGETFQDALDQLELLLRKVMELQEIDQYHKKKFLGMVSSWRGFSNYFIAEFLADRYEQNEPNFAYAVAHRDQEEERFKQFNDLLTRVLEILKDYPVGREEEVTDSDRAAMLRDLEKGVAWVKIGSQSFELDTFALKAVRTHQPLSPDKLQRRREHIVNQTRAKYCRERSEIEQERAEKEHEARKEPETNDLGEFPRFEDS